MPDTWPDFKTFSCIELIALRELMWKIVFDNVHVFAWCFLKMWYHLLIIFSLLIFVKPVLTGTIPISISCFSSSSDSILLCSSYWPGACYFVLAGLLLMIFFFWPPDCWDYQGASPCLTLSYLCRSFHNIKFLSLHLDILLICFVLVNYSLFSFC